MYLPRLIGAKETAVRAPAVTELLPMQGTVLVVEDDGEVREYIVSALTQLGYDVLQAGKASAALFVIECHPEVDVLLTDVGLPSINGRQLADEASRRHAGIKIVFISGYGKDAIVHNDIWTPVSSCYPNRLQ